MGRIQARERGDYRGFVTLNGAIKLTECVWDDRRGERHRRGGNVHPGAPKSCAAAVAGTSSSGSEDRKESGAGVRVSRANGCWRKSGGASGEE
jgi:hypothetical protein